MTREPGPSDPIARRKWALAASRSNSHHAGYSARPYRRPIHCAALERKELKDNFTFGGC